MKVFELPNNTKTGFAYTHKLVIDHTDLTNSTNSAAQTIEVLTAPANTVVQAAATKLVVPFENTADTAFSSTTLEIGDGVDPDRYIVSQELNVNGTEILAKANANTTPHAYAAADTVDCVFTPSSGKNLAALNKGELHVYLRVAALSEI
jgi:hypothetical protein